MLGGYPPGARPNLPAMRGIGAGSTGITAGSTGITAGSTGMSALSTGMRALSTRVGCLGGEYGGAHDPGRVAQRRRDDRGLEFEERQVPAGVLAPATADHEEVGGEQRLEGLVVAVEPLRHSFQDSSFFSRTLLAACVSASLPPISTCPSSELGTSTPSYTSAVPIPVPSVVTTTSPCLPRAAPKRASAKPAASASLTTTTSRSSWRLNSSTASVPIQALSMLAAVRTTPRTTTPGTVMPTAGLVAAPSATSRATTSATASGLPPSGVSMRVRSAANSPLDRSTGAPLMPLPPKSMPKG